MSKGKDSSSSFSLECICGENCPCRFKESSTHLNLVRKRMEKDVFGGTEPPAQLPEIRWINVRGREEHEAILKDSEWCKRLGVDQAYEIMVYLKRWGSWLGQ